MKDVTSSLTDTMSRSATSYEKDTHNHDNHESSSLSPSTSHKTKRQCHSKSSSSSSSISSRRLSKSSKIAIIGTGPSGLSAALSLQQAGFCNITLFEKDDHFYARKDGVSISSK